MAINGLGVRLTAVRRIENLSQEDMSQRLGISRSAYQNYERDQRDLTAQLLLKLFNEFAVDPLWILAGDMANDPRLTKFAADYRKIGMALERRIAERGLSIDPEKKWDAIEFLFDEYQSIDDFAGENGDVDISRIDKVLRLVS
ncbi:helix-turn-helix domain-containing protein [Phaeobacter inhibens]|uniref:helix-turn-helix domain-containing protein n=1 Tax=Phaeobacter inhibens TaxID=221822 RepID=UPI0021A8DF5D|nr:helix-turn-helix transcriptional regulator [Phaeobacter inhibens]UWR48931.1 helix-turn-helix domain-containing protein [Phaeobacter inhibens]